MRYTGPKNRLARREGMDLELKTMGSKSQARMLKKLNIRPGQHGLKRQKKISERGLQLREKQKLRFTFGLTEKKLKSYFAKASLKKGNTVLYVSQYLEKRLDNIVYRLGFAPTRASARQLVSHGHIRVNDKKMAVASYMVKVTDKIAFAKPESIKIPYIEKNIANKDLIMPSWLERKAVAGQLVSEPTQELIAKMINLRLIIEYYSR